MLTDGKQIAAARQLLDWSQADLADQSGVSKPSIIRIEKDLMSVKDDIRQAVEKTLNNHGIAFIPNGVQEKTIDIKRLQGTLGMQEFYDDIYKEASLHGGDLYIFNGVPEKIIHHLTKDWYEMHANRMAQIAQNYIFKVIVQENETGLIGNKFAQYRYFPSDRFYEQTLYVYGQKAAFVSFDNNTVQIIIITQNEIADSMRILCELAWENALRK